MWCSKCDVNVSGKRYTVKSGDLICKSCFNATAPKCQKCKEPIGMGSKMKRHKGFCALSANAVKRILHQFTSLWLMVTFVMIVWIKPIAQCHSCKQGIKPTVRYLRHKNRTWHAECFKCAVCQAWLVDGEFNELNDNLICQKCFVSKVSKKCTTCHEPVITRAVQFGLSTYIPECFIVILLQGKLKSRRKWESLSA